MKKALLLPLLAVLFFSCNLEKTETVSVKGKYALTLPSSMKPVAGQTLNEDASLQYQNALKELYVIVIDEPKKVYDSIVDANSLYDVYKPGLEGYSELIIAGLDSAVTVDSVSGFNDTEINSLKARRYAINGIASGYDIHWKFAFIEGRDKYYQILVWTSKARKEDNDEQMESIITSFRETDKSIRK